MHHYDLEGFTRKGEKICVHESVYIEGYLPLHDHSFLEIFYILSGEGIHIINGERKPLKHGDIIFLSFHSAHTLQPITDDFHWININFYPEFLDAGLINQNNASEFLKLAIFKDLFTSSEHNIGDIVISNVEDEFKNLFQELLKEYNDNEIGYLDNMKHLLIIVLMRIFRRKFDSVPVPDEFNIKNDYLVSLVHEVMKEKFDKHISLKDIAKRAYTSPKYFSKLFKQQVGISLTDFINDERIKKSCELLIQTNYSIVVIMNLVGYNDSKFFYNIFKRITGTTPGDYRLRNALKK